MMNDWASGICKAGVLGAVLALMSGCGAAGEDGALAEDFDEVSQAITVSCDGVPTWQLHTTYPPLAKVKWQGVLYECVNDQAASGWCGQYQPDGLHAEDAWTRLGECACAPLINEVQVRGPVNHGDEWVEVTSSCAAALPLTGLRLVYRSQTGTRDVLLTELNGKTVPANGYLLFTGVQYAGSAPSDGRLSNALTAAVGGGGGIAIIRPGAAGAAAQVLDAVGYGTTSNIYREGTNAPMPPVGSNIARVPNKRDTGNNASDFAVRSPSPRQANP